MRVWGITDGKAGNVAQVRALAEALEAEIEYHSISVNFPWQYLPNRCVDFGLAKIIPVTSYRFPDTAPDLIISCGRKGALVSATLKTPAKRVHIQHPQMSPWHFDLVLPMEHDRLLGANIIATPFALHGITREKLGAARAQWEPKFAHLPKPWNAVLMGGTTNKYHFTAEAMQQLLRNLEHIKGSLLITTSRRTGEGNITLLTQHFKNSGRAFLYTGGIENPYMGMLACADQLYVTDDSVNMMSEAVATGKPVTILPLAGHKNTKPARFARHLADVSVNPQHMMKEIAQSVREVLA